MLIEIKSIFRNRKESRVVSKANNTKINSTCLLIRSENPTNLILDLITNKQFIDVEIIANQKIILRWIEG